MAGLAPVPVQQNMGLLAHAAPVNGGARDLMSGFQIWTPAQATAEAPYEIVGSDFSQVLEVHVRPGEVVTAEPGTMLFTSSNISLGADMGGLGQGCKRCCCAGESMFRLHLQHNGSSATVEKVALTPTFPAKVVPIDLRVHSGLVFNRGAFFAALGKDWRVDLRTVSGLGTCCCGGQGLFMNTLSGNGTVFLNAGGTVMTKILGPGEEIVIDKHALLAFESSVNIGIRRTGGCMVCCCAGQGLFNTVLTGPGFVMVHTMGLEKLKKALGVNAVQANGNNNQSGGSGGSS